MPAGRASLLFPAVNLVVIAGSLLSPRLLVRLGGRRTLLAGFTGIAMGITSLTDLAGGLPVVQLLAAGTLIGAGLGAASVASTQTGTDAADPVYRGVASGLLNSAPGGNSRRCRWYPSRRARPARPSCRAIALASWAHARSRWLAP